MSGNLPNWPGASECYSKIYDLLNSMASNGHIQQRGGKRRLVCNVSGDMDHIINALNKGDEETIKAVLLYNQKY